MLELPAETLARLNRQATVDIVAMTSVKIPMLVPIINTIVEIDFEVATENDFYLYDADPSAGGNIAINF
jgi:hypothetical protein